MSSFPVFTLLDVGSGANRIHSSVSWFFFSSTIYSCPRRCAYTILETFLCTYVHTVWHSILTVFMVAAVRTRSDFSNRLKTMATDLRCFYYWSLTVFLNSWFTVLKLCTQYLVYSHTFNINVRRKCRTLITSCIALFGNY